MYCLLRIDDYSSIFAIIHLLNNQSKNCYHYWNINNYKYSVKDMMNVAYKKYNKKRSLSNLMFGSAIFASKCTQFKNPILGLYSKLPRPYETCRPKGIGQLFMKRISF